MAQTTKHRKRLTKSRRAIRYLYGCKFRLDELHEKLSKSYQRKLGWTVS